MTPATASYGSDLPKAYTVIVAKLLAARSDVRRLELEKLEIERVAWAVDVDLLAAQDPEPKDRAA